MYTHCQINHPTHNTQKALLPLGVIIDRRMAYIEQLNCVLSLKLKTIKKNTLAHGEGINFIHIVSIFV